MTNIDDILSILNNTKVSSNWSATNSDFQEIKQFIEDNTIENGSKAIPTKYIYALYVEQERTPIKKGVFSFCFSKFFKSKRSRYGFYYHLNPLPFNLPVNYSMYRELKPNFKYKKTRYNNIKSTPDGWMLFLDFKEEGRKVFSFIRHETNAAKLADRLAFYYFGPTYKYFNYPNLIKNYTPTDVSIFQDLKHKDCTNDEEKSIQENTTK